MMREHLSHFGWLEPWLARGGQPDDDGYRWLAKNGITTLVDLRTRDERDRDDPVAMKLEFVHIPVENDEAPEDAQSMEWLRLCASSAENKKIYVHCKQGEGRTSMFCVLARLAQGRDLRSAMEEQRRFGFEPEGAHHRQAEYLTDFSRRATAGELVLPKLG